MEIIEKQVEKVKEVPTDGCYNYGRRDVNGKANAGLTLGIIGTALGAWALFGNKRGNGLLGLAGSGLGGSNININGLETGLGAAMKPFITRALDKNFDKVTKTLDLISDKEGNIDIENIITEMTENLMNTNPFTFKTSFIGDIEIGGGEIKFNLPFTSKRLVLNITDLETFKEMLITKS